MSCTSCTASRIEAERSLEHADACAAAELGRRSCGSIALTRSTTSTVLASGLALDRQHERALCRRTSWPVWLFSTESITRATSPRRTGWPLRVATMMSRNCVGVGQLRLRLDGQVLARPCDGADRRVGVGGGDRRLHLVDADAARGQRVRIELDAHGVFLAAEDLHLADAVDGRQRRRDHLLGEGVELGQRRGLAAAAPAAGSARRPD